MTIIDGMGDDDYLETLGTATEQSGKNAAKVYKRRRPMKGATVNKMDQTCIDTDDDDLEF
jgi:hypothetical protein